MYDYVAFELPDVIDVNFNTNRRRGIMGHSMGGHGAMVIGLREPERFASVSAISPICAPSKSPWGRNAFAKFLGDDESAWASYDTCRLIEKGATRRAIRVDQGGSDEFLQSQLMTDELIRVGNANDFPIEVKMHEGCDHSYYFVASVMAEHVRYHGEQITRD
jgi:S-formylglutathione hydrolase